MLLLLFFTKSNIFLFFIFSRSCEQTWVIYVLLFGPECVSCQYLGDVLIWVLFCNTLLGNSCWSYFDHIFNYPDYLYLNVYVCYITRALELHKPPSVEADFVLKEITTIVCSFHFPGKQPAENGPRFAR